MPFRKSLGVALWSPDGDPNTTLIGGDQENSNVHIRKFDDGVTIATDNGKNGSDEYSVNVLSLTKMEALVLSHELRKLAIGV